MIYLLVCLHIGATTVINVHINQDCETIQLDRYNILMAEQKQILDNDVAVRLFLSEPIKNKLFSQQILPGIQMKLI